MHFAEVISITGRSPESDQLQFSSHPLECLDGEVEIVSRMRG
jgi:hypothetical protein